MTDSDDIHRPTPEFRSSLEREIGRAYRAELLFADRSDRRRRVAMIAGLAAGAVFTLTVGLILGASTSYASAEELTVRQREATATAVELGHRFAALRMQLARTSFERVKADFDRGKASDSALHAAQADVDSTRANLSKLEVTLRDARDTMPLPRPTFALIRFPFGGASTNTANCAPATPAAPVIASSTQEPVIPTVELPAASTRSAETFGVIVNVRELSGQKVLVNDGGHRQVRLLESTLAAGKVIIDSARGNTAFNYGGRTTAIDPFIGDSALFINQAGIVSVIDGNGGLARALAMPNPKDVDYMRRAGVDSLSRLIWQGPATVTRTPANDTPPVVADSAPIMRADLVARRNDTIGYVYRPLVRNDGVGPGVEKSRMIMSTWQPDPLREIDEWTVLADGSLAIVRGHDYHVDFVRPDGSKHVGPKLPFDWRRVSDDEKTVLIDSAAAQRVTAARNNTLIAGVERAAPGWKITGAFPDTTDALPSENIGRTRFLVLAPPRPSVEHVFDYYPPVRAGSVLADLDNHLWILPNTSKQSKAGELVYDVVNNQGALIKRVRLPAGRYIVGFGRNGVVYLATGSIVNGFTVERTQLPK